MKILSKIFLSTACTLGLSLTFQIDAAAETLTWDACVQQATSTNADLQTARTTRMSYVYQKRGAYSGFFPQISADANYTYADNPGNAGADSFFSGSVAATQNIFAGFLDKAKVDQAKANLERSDAQLTSTRAQVSFELKSAFSGVVYAQNAILLAKDIIERRRYNLNLVELRFDSGRENKGSYLLSKAYLKSAEYDHFQAQNVLLLSQIQLARALGRDDAETLEVSGRVPTSPAPLAVDLAERVLETPEYAQAIAAERAADAAKLLARSAFYPNLNLTASAGRSGNDWLVDESNWLVGAGISLPIFNGGRDYYASKSTAESRLAASFSTMNVVRQGMVNLKQTYLRYLEAALKVEVDRSFVDAATVREKIAQEKYNNGLLSFEDWDIIENDLIGRQKQFLLSERDRVVAEAAWEQAQGKGAIP